MLVGRAWLMPVPRFWHTPQIITAELTAEQTAEHFSPVGFEAPFIRCIMVAASLRDVALAVALCSVAIARVSASAAIPERSLRSSRYSSSSKCVGINFSSLYLYSSQACRVTVQSLNDRQGFLTAAFLPTVH